MILDKIRKRLTEEVISDWAFSRLEAHRDNILEILAEIYPKILEEGKLSFRKLSKYNRKEKLERRLLEASKEYKKDFGSDLRKKIVDEASDSAETMQNFINSKAAAKKVEDISISLGRQAIRSEVIDLAHNATIADKTMSDYINKMAVDLSFDIEQVVLQGIHDGVNPDVLSSKLANEQDLMTKYKRRLNGNVRSWYNKVINEADHIVMEKAGVQEKLYLATMDSATCPVCAADHGKPFKLNEAPIMPRHNFCRCTYGPIIVEEDKNINVDYSDWILDGRRSMDQLQQLKADLGYYYTADRIKKADFQRLNGIVGQAIKQKKAS